MAVSQLPPISSGKQPLVMTSALKESLAVRAGPRRGIFGVRPNVKYYEEKRQIGLKELTQFPFTGAEKYVGEWQGNMKEGFGTQTWTKGHKYEGEWVANKRTGKGTFFVCEGGNKLRKQYTGDWVDDQKHGVGVFTSKNGDRYEGEWRYNVKHGMGKMFYGEGSEEESYNGSWSGGKRSGLGILTMRNGDRFEGHWGDDKREGPGRYFYKATNKVYEGEWFEGVPKCGQLRDAPPGSFPDEPASSTSPEAFSIPALRLLAPEAVVSEAVTRIRQDAAAQTADSRSFNAEEVDILKQCFAEFDPDETGYVYCGDLYNILQAAGLNVAQATVDQVVASLEADAASQLNFAEFVDVASILADVQ